MLRRVELKAVNESLLDGEEINKVIGGTCRPRFASRTHTTRGRTLLYQVASLAMPFDGYSIGRHDHCVLLEGHCPDVKITRNSSMGKMSPVGMLQNRTALSGRIVCWH